MIFYGVMNNDVKLSDDNSGNIKCRLVWDTSVHLTALKRHCSLLNTTTFLGCIIIILVTYGHHIITDNVKVKPSVVYPNSQRDHNYGMEAAPRTTLADLDFTSST